MEDKMKMNLMKWLASMGLLVALFGVLPEAAAAPPTPDSPFVEPEVQVLHTFTGENIGDQFGWVSENLGDLNGDGVNDFIISARFNADNGTQAGKVYVYSGKDFQLLNTITGNPGEWFGYSVSKGGDINADGTPDYLVGGRGRVVAYSGKMHEVIHEWSKPRIFFGADVDGAGDVNGDGYDDVLVGAPRASFTYQFAGRVYLFSGKDGSELWTRDGQGEENYLGYGVGKVGLLDGDGAPEVAASAYQAGKAKAGEVYVYSGATGFTYLTLEPFARGTTEFYGVFFTQGAGDINADGVPDIYVGDYGNKRGGGEGTGRAYVFSGADGSQIYVLNGEDKEDGFGPGRGAGDVNGDGYGDLVIGAWTSEASGVRKAGKGYVFSGKDGSVMRTMTSQVKNDYVGVDAIAVGDVNGDGLTDYLLTGVDFNGTHLDHSYVIAGIP
jgi:hypothetical protein